jgi:hypothetical protein
MKSAIFYFKEGGDPNYVFEYQMPIGIKLNGKVYTLRYEVVDEDITKALDITTPEENEIVMNSVPLGD